MLIHQRDLDILKVLEQKDRGDFMKCKYCTTENDEWSEYCKNCRKRLKPIEYKKSTKIGIYIAMVLNAFFAILNTMGLAKNIKTLSSSLIIYSCFFTCFMLITIVGLIFVLKKKKRGFIICIISLMVNMIYGLIVGASLFECLIILLPIIYALFSVGSYLKELDI